MKCLREEKTEVIFSNVLIDENDKPRLGRRRRRAS